RRPPLPPLPPPLAGTSAPPPPAISEPLPQRLRARATRHFRALAPAPARPRARHFRGFGICASASRVGHFRALGTRAVCAFAAVQPAAPGPAPPRPPVWFNQINTGCDRLVSTGLYQLHIS